MNGELGEIYNRLVKLETLTEERWLAHDNRSREMKDSLDCIKEKVMKLPCEVHLERFQGFQNSIAWLYAWIGGVAGLSIYGFFFLLNN
jgi:hypothetical protein